MKNYNQDQGQGLLMHLNLIGAYTRPRYQVGVYRTIGPFV